jgi:DNA-binding winged helix-turn-helix (wHTH) protein
MSTQAPAIAQEDPTAFASLQTWPARYARFGQFHIDLQREELYRDGRRAKVQAKIYQALLVLMTRPGEIITRDEVCRRLWPEALHANLDANVNTTINKLRLVLSDTPDTPAYIETIPRRGYSFIAAVQFFDEPLPIKAPANAGNAPRAALSPSWRQGNWWLSVLRLQSTPVRLASFVLLGMLMGALLILVWKVASNKNQASERLGKQSVSLPAQTDRDL